MTSPTIETAIWLAIKSRVATLPLAYPKAWPGQTFQPPSTAGVPVPYLRVGQVVATPMRLLISSGRPHHRAGRVVIALVHPLGQDVSVYNQIAGIIANHFKDGTMMHYNGSICVTVPRAPHVQEGYEDAGYWCVPVTIRWLCYA